MSRMVEGGFREESEVFVVFVIDFVDFVIKKLKTKDTRFKH